MLPPRTRVCAPAYARMGDARVYAHACTRPRIRDRGVWGERNPESMNKIITESLDPET